MNLPIGPNRGHRIDRHGSIANADVVRIAGVDTLKASKLLGAWRQQGLLVSLPSQGERNMAYTRPRREADAGRLFSALQVNNSDASQDPL